MGSNPPLHRRYGVHEICETSLPKPHKGGTFQENKDERISTETTPCLKREVGLLNTIALLIGLAVGSSIFTVPSIVFVKTGSAGVAIVLFSLAGVKALLGGLCYAELAALLPASGGNYAYLTAASKSMGKYGDVIPFMSVWVSLTICEPMTAAYQGLTFSSYALSLVYGDCSLSYSANVMTALAFTALGTAVNCFSVKTSTRVQGVLTTVKTFVLISVIITGAVWAFRDNKLLEAPLFSGVTPSNLAQAFFAATSCYGGCNSITYIAEEIKDPTRTIPLAMAIGIVILTLINVLTNVAFFVVLDASTVASSDAIAVSFAMVTWGTAAAFCVPLVVSVSAFGSLCAGFFSGSRLKLAAARQGHLPHVLSFITVDSSVPLPSVLFRGLLALAYTFAGSLSFILDGVTFVYAINDILTMISFFVLRSSMKDVLRPFRLPTVIPVLYLAALLTLVGVTLASPSGYLKYLVVIVGYLVGFCYYVLFVRFKTHLPGSEKAIVLVQKFLMCVPCVNELDLMLKEKL